MPESEHDVHYALTPAVGRHGATLHQNSRVAPMEGRRIAPEGLRHTITQLPPGLQDIHTTLRA
jgi:hypothetical protein